MWHTMCLFVLEGCIMHTAPCQTLGSKARVSFWRVPHVAVDSTGCTCILPSSWRNFAQLLT